MIIREATVQDIINMHRIRLAVKENILSTPSFVTPEHYRKYLTTDGKGWVSEYNELITGFAIVDIIQHNVWALFVDPLFEGKGIGKQLQSSMLNWYFSQTQKTIWLSTATTTRAENFYKRTGWSKAGILQNQEAKFEMTYERWLQLGK